MRAGIKSVLMLLGGSLLRVPRPVRMRVRTGTLVTAARARTGDTASTRRREGRHARGMMRLRRTHTARSESVCTLRCRSGAEDDAATDGGEHFYLRCRWVGLCPRGWWEGCGRRLRDEERRRFAQTPTAHLQDSLTGRLRCGGLTAAGAKRDEGEDTGVQVALSMLRWYKRACPCVRQKNRDTAWVGVFVELPRAVTHQSQRQVPGFQRSLTQASLRTQSITARQLPTTGPVCRMGVVRPSRAAHTPVCFRER